MNTQNVPHILVVDDDPVITEMLEQYLSEHEFRVSVARNGEEMRQVLQRASVQLVLMDLRLRGESGLTLARDLREQRVLPVIILTGQAEEADRVMGLELAADDYVVKPFSLRELLARIRAVLRRYAPAVPDAAAVSADAGLGYRDTSHPAEAGKSESGAHTTGRACDVAVSHGEAWRLMGLSF
ncbi:response regulator, partial [Leptospira sp. 96542]|nr:response regulator [Leptospira sp. 96542]